MCLLSYLAYGYFNPTAPGELSATAHKDEPIEKSASDVHPEPPQLVEPIVETELPAAARKPIKYRPRSPIDESGYLAIMKIVAPWPKETSLLGISKRFQGAAKRAVADIDRYLLKTEISKSDRSIAEFTRASFLNFDGDPDKAYDSLVNSRKILESVPELAERDLFTIIYFQGLTALRKGENENCIMCRGESSCILPITSKAVHTNQAGSRLAIQHFTEYLEVFPRDLHVAWLLNVAHMTLDEHPAQVDPRFLVSLDYYNNDKQHSIGKFRDVGHLVGVNRFNQAGGGIMEDFDNDGLLDIMVSSFDPTQALGFYRNTGTGKFEDITKEAGLSDQLGGLNCMQTDYDNDGDMDVLVVRGAWLSSQMAMRPTLVRNNGDKTFTDVTIEAGLGEPVNSIAAQWSDYDNDGWLDLFVCCEQQANRLYHNLRNGTFEEVAQVAGVAGSTQFLCKGVAWIDFDNDGFQDLFLNHLSKEGGQLFRNNRDGTFTRDSKALGIDGPAYGFACWSWDYDNDGWLDIFATSYDRTLADIVMGLVGQPHQSSKNRLFRNLAGKGFEDVTTAVGLNDCYATMGSNFGDFDNDGFLDMYLGTGEPDLSTLVPNRMIRNLGGKQFAEITSSSGTGNLQKGHGVACGDWDCDGNVDIFIEMGGAVNGDKYHNILFQNPGHDNSWCTLKLVGEKSNRAAIGARIKVVTDGELPQTLYRTVCSGSSFGASPLQQTIGLGKAQRIAELEIQWPTTGTTQTFLNVPIGKFIEIHEFAEDYRVIERETIKLPVE